MDSKLEMHSFDSAKNLVRKRIKNTNPEDYLTWEELEAKLNKKK